MNTQERVWKIGWIVGILLAVFLGVLSIKTIKSIGYVGKDAPYINNISVNGKGEVISIPDVATFSFSVMETAKTVAEAQTKATEKINAALKAVRDAGVADKDIKTISYSISPHYEYQGGLCTGTYCNPGKSVLTGYDVSQTTEVKIRDLTKAGAIFTTVGSLKVENVNSLAFTIDDIEKVRAEARTKAIADAQAKAKELAKQLGVDIVRITSYYDASNDNPSYYAREAALSSDAMVKNQAAPTPEIPAGEQKVISNVTITYEIK